MKSNILALLLATAAIHPSQATFGLDWADAFSLSDLQCFRSHGANFVIVRAWHSYGAFDTNGPVQISNAHKAGIPNVDVYAFPCRSMGAEE